MLKSGALKQHAIEGLRKILCQQFLATVWLLPIGYIFSKILEPNTIIIPL
jgi:hypothetical protein